MSDENESTTETQSPRAAKTIVLLDEHGQELRRIKCNLLLRDGDTITLEFDPRG